MTELSARGSSFSSALAVNSKDEVAGFAYLPGTRIGQAVLWRHGKMIRLGTLGGQSSVARAINDRGQVVGDSDLASGESHGFLWQRGKMTDPGVLSANDINNAGDYVGAANVPGGLAGYRWLHRKIPYQPPMPTAFISAAPYISHHVL